MSALQVLLGDIEVGILEHFEDESERFTFSDSYFPISEKICLVL
jgi:hypothetical protein